MWLRDPGLRKLNFLIFLMFSTGASTGYVGSLINGLQVLPFFTIFTQNLSPSTIGLMIASGAIGSFVSYIPASYIADTLGRKKCVGIGSTIVIITSLFQGVFPNRWVFMSTRLVAGIGSGIAAAAAPLLVTEIAHPHTRQSATAIYNTTWCMGSITSAVVTILTLNIASSWSWRLPCLLQMVYPSLQIISLMFVPESPRWLVSAGRKSEALCILRKYHSNGNEHDEIVQKEFDQICSLIPLNSKSATHGWKKFFSCRGSMHMLGICIMVGFMQEWAGNGVISYYLAPILTSVGVTKVRDQAVVNIGMQIWNLIVSALGGLASEKYGRRTLWLLSTMLMILFLALVTIVTGLYKEQGLSAAGVAAVPLLFLFFGAFDIAYGSLFIAYPVEILPFHLRAKGLATTLLSDSVAAFSNQYVNPVAFSSIGWKYYCVFLGCLSFFLLIIYFFFPETKGKSLEEISESFMSKHQADTSSEKQQPEKC
ncbi:hypothetical protein N7462_008383 [Penicillium macrosclerotiorum]|uniref:uncharacterized protein n=1 Tax=Penicillium macrosclerotiorum TaxID=303699 RepID=UPI0025469461|nr:uncharacterized protein N7462_008383 [Penicillium macrosclerotiorum]KAJ5675486.1 hypothetical protein N7462_008383 [Penicillium macrosclerotiorum]